MRSNRTPSLLRGAILLLTACVGSRADAVWDLTVTVNGATLEQQERIEAAARMWENAIAGYQPGISLTSVAVSVSFADLPGGTLGQAGPTSFVDQGGLTLSTAGTMTLDSGLGLDVLEDVTAHEIGHILGIGTLWTSNALYVNGSGQYTGEFGVAAYREEVDRQATFVPVELDGGSGTANAHWDESGFFAHELMSGFLSGSNFVSETTIASLRDLGFDTIGGIADLTGVDGDVNQDGFLTLLDIVAFVDGWESVTTGLSAVERTQLGDLDLSGMTDLADAYILHRALPLSRRVLLFNALSSGRLEIPEPDAAVSAVVVISLIFARWRSSFTGSRASRLT